MSMFQLNIPLEERSYKADTKDRNRPLIRSMPSSKDFGGSDSDIMPEQFCLLVLLSQLSTSLQHIQS